MRNLGVVLAFGALGWMVPGLATAQRAAQDATLSACVTRVAQEARAESAKPFGKPRVGFLLSGEHRAFGYRLPHDGCYGFAAVGHRQVQHLGLTLYAPNGRILARGPGRNAYTYARVCGRAGREFQVEIRMVDGSGEFHLVPLWNGPERLRALAATMRECMEAGAPRPGPVDVGPEPPAPAPEVELRSVARRLAAKGYEAKDGVLFGGLPPRGREARRVRLPGGRCYALAAVGGTNVGDIDLRLLAVRNSARVVAADVTRRRNAVVKVCPQDSTVYVLDIHMYRGSGDYVVKSFGLRESPGVDRIGVEGGTRIPYAEAQVRFATHGMRTETFTWGMLKPGETQSMPLQLSAGQCYAVAALATPDFEGGDLDMSLVDARGRLVAAEHGPNPHPMVFHCAERSAVYKAIVRSRDVRQPSRYLILLGKDAEHASGVEVRR